MTVFVFREGGDGWAVGSPLSPMIGHPYAGHPPAGYALSTGWSDKQDRLGRHVTVTLWVVLVLAAGIVIASFLAGFAMTSFSQQYWQ
jgi:hypothetical protein